MPARHPNLPFTLLPIGSRNFRFDIQSTFYSYWSFPTVSPPPPPKTKRSTHQFVIAVLLEAFYSSVFVERSILKSEFKTKTAQASRHYIEDVESQLRHLSCFIWSIINGLTW